VSGRSTNAIHHEPATAARQSPPPPLALTGPLLAWLLVQLAALILSAARTRLWAEAPHAGELLSLRVLLISQIATSALLSPLLFQNRPVTLAVVASSWPFLVLGGLLSALPWATIVSTSLFVSAWLAALALGQSPLSSTRWHLTRIGLVTLWTSGGPLLLFVRMEYGGGQPFGTWGEVALGPIIAGNHLIDGQFSSAWRLLLIAGIASLIAHACGCKSTHSPAQQVL
jgi:hypothetical protein